MILWTSPSLTLHHASEGIIFSPLPSKYLGYEPPRHCVHVLLVLMTELPQQKLLFLERGQHCQCRKEKRRNEHPHDSPCNGQTQIHENQTQIHRVAHFREHPSCDESLNLLRLFMGLFVNPVTICVKDPTPEENDPTNEV